MEPLHVPAHPIVVVIGIDVDVVPLPRRAVPVIVPREDSLDAVVESREGAFVLHNGGKGVKVPLVEVVVVVVVVDKTSLIVSKCDVPAVLVIFWTLLLIVVLVSVVLLRPMEEPLF
jgi:hypothetical protein